MTLITRGRRATLLTVALTAAALAPAVNTSAHADANAVPSYEVKLNLGASALDSTGTPTAAVRSAFGLSSTGAKRSYSYYDTSALALDAQGWSVRLRHKSGKDFEETSKKRYAVSNGDVASTPRSRRPTPRASTPPTPTTRPRSTGATASRR
ncbi:CYTH domain-containing protein [Luteipulveratus halotolerans]|uniref:hypothetical protein n=1 Tax=Luteipulveratus halotolerans TaxID=1631356 RepID=UPI0018D10F7E|nr:hypothetical protein [Luteipulveratus halotolerans]